MRKENRHDRYKSKINPEDDGLNRTYFGNPTVGGLIIIILIVLYFVFFK